ncbi:UNVERIFIED_CONTAM: Patellin-4 [Sesamum angustifolium]|uniref:Patellin-4 n=1 Tax=Sesamum angustifolium TaxID=2727405 RepID=A0AAW2PA23_9LAMI
MVGFCWQIFINVPFWYYAFHSLLTPFLTQRTRSKLVFARPSKVTETLLKYVPIQEIPIQYGGIKRDNDFEFSASDGEATEVVIKAGSTQTIEIPTPEKGKKMCSDEAPVRKTFKNQEPGKIGLTVQNCSGKKKKLFYRYKVKKACF